MCTIVLSCSPTPVSLAVHNRNINLPATEKTVNDTIRRQDIRLREFFVIWATKSDYKVWCTIRPDILRPLFALLEKSAFIIILIVLCAHIDNVARLLIESHDISHQGEALPVSNMWVCREEERQPPAAHVQARRSEALPVWSVWQGVHTEAGT